MLSRLRFLANSQTGLKSRPLKSTSHDYTSAFLLSFTLSHSLLHSLILSLSHTISLDFMDTNTLSQFNHTLLIQFNSKSKQPVSLRKARTRNRLPIFFFTSALYCAHLDLFTHYWKSFLLFPQSLSFSLNLSSLFVVDKLRLDKQ